MIDRTQEQPLGQDFGEPSGQGLSRIAQGDASPLVRQMPRLRLTLQGWGRLGEALAEYGGKRVFVFGGIAGEEVVAEVVKERRRYIAARVVEVLSPSPYRVAPPCPYFGECTGCQWQHIDYRYQLQLKKEMVLDAFRRVGGFEDAPVSDPVPAPEMYGYRNHARFTVAPDGVLGFVNRESRRFVPIDRCLIMHAGINEALATLQGQCQETTQLSIRYGINTGDILVQPPLSNSTLAVQSGQRHYHESLKGRVFRVGSPSFFQVNTLQAERMVDIVLEKLNPRGDELLVDAYSGVGTFAILLASMVGKVVGIEESSSAIKDARANAEGVEGVEFAQGKAEEMMASMEQRPDFVILDPPRTGCNPKVLEALVRLAPRKVVYLSCDPATLARDVKLLCQGPFHLEEVQPVDLFPQTHHVECIASLALQGHAGPLILASESPRRKELMPSLGVEFTVVPPVASEDTLDGESPERLVERLALDKAMSVAQGRHKGLVLGADTVVVHEGKVMGKPGSVAEAVNMLKNLRGREHRVVTGVAVVEAGSGKARTKHKVSTVVMRDYTDGEIKTYVGSGEPMDKAGGYAVQDIVFRPAGSVAGCYANVIGLPLCTVAELLPWFGVRLRSGWLGTRREVCGMCLDAKEASWTF